MRCNNSAITHCRIILLCFFSLLTTQSLATESSLLSQKKDVVLKSDHNAQILPQDESRHRDKLIAADKQHVLSQQNMALAIPQPPLSSLEDLARHLSLAEQYAADNKFELAYLEKEAYIKKYRLYRKDKRKDMIATLTKNYDVDEKNTLNEMLKSKNKLKMLRVLEIKQEQKEQQERFIWIIAIALVFILLFSWQLKVRHKLIKLAKVDVLTGLANRVTLFRHGHRLVKKYIVQPFDFSVLLIDLDYFKRVNDDYGHQVGDKVLITIAELISETMRSRDILARLGGEEFVALLPFADENKAKAIAMHINEKISQYDFSAFGIKEKLTLSIGIASMEDKNSRFDDILHGADLAMYQAKKQGRNRVISYQSIARKQERRGN